MLEPEADWDPAQDKALRRWAWTGIIVGFGVHLLLLLRWIATSLGLDVRDWLTFLSFVLPR